MSKGLSALVFECDSDGEFIAINHIMHEARDANADEDEEVDDDTPQYTGPVFDELDDTLQQVRGAGPAMTYACHHGMPALICHYRSQVCWETMNGIA